MRATVRRLRRALFILPYVARHPRGVRLAELARMFEVSPREMAAEVERLMVVGLPGGDPADFFDVCVEGTGAAARVLAVPSRLLRRPPRLTPDEARSLLLGAAALRRTGLPVFDEALARATEKIRALLLRGKTTAEAVAIDAGGPVRDEVFAPLARASRERRTVELDYASLSSQRRRKIVVEPYGLLNHGGGWYLLGKSRTHREDRVFVFRLERIQSVTVLDERFELPADFDLRKHHGDRMFIAGLAPVEVKLRLHGAAAGRLGARFRRVRLEPGGAMVVRFRDVPNGWLGAWVLRQGSEVEVLSPRGLADWVREVARRVSDAHAGLRESADSAETPVAARGS